MTGYRLNAEPNFYGCHDPQCLDSTWDHECPVTPDADPDEPIGPLLGEVLTLIDEVVDRIPPEEIVRRRKAIIADVERERG